MYKLIKDYVRTLTVIMSHHREYEQFWFFYIMLCISKFYITFISKKANYKKKGVNLGKWKQDRQDDARNGIRPKRFAIYLHPEVRILGIAHPPKKVNTVH